MQNELLSTRDLARRLNIPAHRIEYALAARKIKEPKLRVAGRRLFDAEDIQRTTEYFNRKRKEKVLEK